MRSGIIVSVLALLISGSAGAADYYVDQAKGSSGGSGSEAAPFQDLDQCAGVVQPGDTCWIKSGTYSKGYVAYTPGRSGTSSNPITFQAFPGHYPVIKAPGFDEPALGFKTPRRYITYRGLKIDGTLRIDAERGNEAVGILIENNEVYNGSYHDDGNWTGVYLQDVADSWVRNNNIHHIRKPSATNGAGIRFYRATRVVFEHNWIHDNAQEGIYAKQGNRDNIYRRNILERNPDQQIKLAGYKHPTFDYWSQDELIYENIMICDLKGATGSSSDEVGVWVKANNTGTKIYNNTFINCDAILSGNENGQRNTGWEVYNNIFYNADNDTARWLESRWTAGNNPALMDSNLFWVAPGASGSGEWKVENWGSGERTYGSLGSWQGAYSGSYGGSSLNADPLFVDMAGDDFHLSSSSPARGRGTGGVDIGAYPQGYETVIGPSGELPPPESFPPPSEDEPPPPDDGNPPPDDGGSVPPAASCTDPPANAFFCDGFETDLAGWTDVQTRSGNMKIQTGVVANGSSALAADLVPGDSGVYASHYFGDHPLLGSGAGASLDEVYLAGYVRFDSAYLQQGGKVFQIAIFEGWQAGYPGPNSWAPTYILLNVDAGGRAIFGDLHRKTSGDSWREMQPNLASVTIAPDRWVHVTFHVKLNTPGSSDGVFEVWIDGQQTVRYTNVNFRDSYTQYGINNVMISSLYSSPDVPMSLYWDDVVISGEEIVAGPTPPPTPPPTTLGTPGRPMLVQPN
jgi:hypothetical protein